MATPIGNLGDMVPRAVEILQRVALIAVEDTRHSGRLLQHFQIDTPTFAYHDHNEQHAKERLLQKCLGGEDVALISDAGTPLISDPGYRLVQAARVQGIAVSPIPGACAAIAALSAAGLPSDRFSFEGFLPAKASARESQLKALSTEAQTLIFYEAPHRIVATLEAMVAVFGETRELVLARELTKTFETFLSGTAAEVLAQVVADPNQQKGEMVLIVRGDSGEKGELDARAQEVMTLLAKELPLNRAAAVAAKITGHKKSVLYDWALAQKK